MSMPTKQPEEVEEATVDPEERDVESASLGAISKSCKSRSFLPADVKLPREAQISRKQ
jgi:hypothetical protein